MPEINSIEESLRETKQRLGRFAQPTIKTGQLYCSNLPLTVLEQHPEALAVMVMKHKIDPYTLLIKVVNESLDGQEKNCMIVSTEKGSTFEYMKCDFTTGTYFFTSVVHYQLLIDEKVYWQSYRSEEDFFRIWRPL